MQITTILLAAAYIAQTQAAVLLRPRTVPIVNDDNCHDETATLPPATTTSSILQGNSSFKPTALPVHASPEYGNIGIELTTTTTAITTPSTTATSSPDASQNFQPPSKGPSPLPLPSPQPATKAAAVSALAAGAAPTVAPIPAPPVHTTDPSVIVTVPSFQEAYGNEYVQTTYYSCNTFAATTHCGWHEPLIYVGGNGKSSSASSLSSSSSFSSRLGKGVIVAGIVALFGI